MNEPRVFEAPPPSLLWAAAAFAVFFLGQIAVGAVAFAFELPVESLAVGVLGMLIGGIASTELILWSLRRQGSSPRAIGLERPRWVQDIAWGVVTAIAALLTVAAVIALCVWAGLPKGWFEQPALSEVLAPDSAPDAALIVLLAVFFAPVFEEVLFRGQLFAAFASRVGTPSAIVLTSLIFSAVHIQGVVPLTVLGLAYAAVRSWTGRVFPAIVAHALTNAVAVVGLFATAPS